MQQDNQGQGPPQFFLASGSAAEGSSAPFSSSPEALMEALGLLQQKIGALQNLLPLIVQSGDPSSPHMAQQQQAAAAGVATVISQLAVAAADMLPPSGMPQHLQHSSEQQSDPKQQPSMVLPYSMEPQPSIMYYKQPQQTQQLLMPSSSVFAAQFHPFLTSGAVEAFPAPHSFPSATLPKEPYFQTLQEPQQSYGAGASRDEDDDGDGEVLAPGSFELIEVDATEILAEHTRFCEICGKGFKRDANLRMHMRGHGDEYKSAAALARPDKEGAAIASSHSRRYSCPSEGCKRNKQHRKFIPLKTMLCVKNHYRRSHCPKMLTCSKCHAKKFSVVADLKTHEKHCGRDKWQCSCGTNFSRKDKLLGHLALFSGHTPAMPLHIMEGISSSSNNAGASRELAEESATSLGHLGLSMGSGSHLGNPPTDAGTPITLGLYSSQQQQRPGTAVGGTENSHMTPEGFGVATYVGTGPAEFHNLFNTSNYFDRPGL